MCDDYIVMARLHCKLRRKPNDLPEAPSHAVTLHRIALFFRDSKAGAWRFVRNLAVEHFEIDLTALAPFTLAHTQNFRPALEPTGDLVFFLGRHRP